MGKKGRGRGQSSSARGRGQTSSLHRIRKSTSPAASPPAILLTGPDGHVAIRTPIRTRSTSKKQSEAASAVSGTGSGIEPKPTGSKSTGKGDFLSPNRYESLSEEDTDLVSTSDDDDDDGTNKSTGKKVENKAAAKQKRQPPVYIVGHDVDVIDELLQGRRYCLKLGKSSVQVFTFDKQNFVDVINDLKSNGIKHYTFSPVEDTPIKIVLGGYMDRPIPELEKHLHGSNVRPREIKILSRKTTETGTHTLYLLFFDRGTVKIQDLRKIKALDGFWVNWRFYSKNPSDAAQCHRCQKYGHGSRHCNLPARCVKCGGAHLTEACSLPRKANLGDNAEQTKARIKCANCNGNHTSNYRGCPARRTYLEELKKRKKPAASHTSQKITGATGAAAGQRTVPGDKPAFPPGWGRSWASVVASSSGNTGQQEVTGDDLFTLPEFFALAGEMMTRFRSCRNKADQFMALGELMMKHIYNGYFFLL